MADNLNWYVVHTYSGYENTVKATIEKYVENRHLQDVIHEISIPMETVTEITDNGPKEVERKVFPGYVLVKMVMNDETWHVIRNIRGVTGFLGEGNNAIPLSEDDVAARHRGRGRPGPGQGPGGRLHVRTGDPRGAGAGPGGAHRPVRDPGWLPRGVKPHDVGGTAPSVPPNRTQSVLFNHIFSMEVLFRGTESNWICKTSDPRRQGDSRPPGRPRPGPARREHRRFYQGVQPLRC